MPYLFKKAWIAVSLLASVNATAQESESNPKCPTYEQGHEASESQMMAAYSAPACVKLTGYPWDVYVTSSFIYWQAQQENMEIGLISSNDPNVFGDNPFSTSYVNNMSITQPNFTFIPGFKFGIGGNFDWDGWDAYGEYTRYHGTTASGVSPLKPSTATAGNPSNGKYLYPMQGAPGAYETLFFRSANQSWNLKMDLVDISLARAYYSGTKLSIRPFFGGRGAWIRQNLSTFYNGSTSNYSTDNGYSNATQKNYSASWGIGPRAGFESNWMLGYGLRFLGNGSADILYTRYRTHSDAQVVTLAAGSAVPITSNSAVSQSIDYLRTHLDAEIGIGWGSYFDQQNWHVDLSATYGFQVFWDQNMFRNFLDSSMQAKSFTPNGNLYIQGVTANARFDF
jgi:hypothetical protein